MSNLAIALLPAMRVQIGLENWVLVEVGQQKQNADMPDDNALCISDPEKHLTSSTEYRWKGHAARVNTANMES